MENETINESGTTTLDNWADDDLELSETLGTLLDNPLPQAAFHALRTNEQNVGFNNNAGGNWLYPSNMPLRNYQYSITQAALFKNTLIVLPTGLGKTFIAAVVMYNMYRWYPLGKVIFMAPTRPLVNQQIEACKKIMPFPAAETIELTGKITREKRLSYWRDKRVIFATPQALQSDMFGQQPEDLADFPFEDVKLIVIDEAHRAKGRYAYVEVTRALFQRNKYFRVLALTATPGRTIDDVAEVIRNLFISHIEVRWETSIDVMQYIHKRNLKTIVVPYGEQIERIRERLMKIIDPHMRQLIELDAISGSHQNITRNYLIMEQKRFREHTLRQGAHAQQTAITRNFSICISLCHALELLERHGLRVFLNSFEEDDEGHEKFALTLNPELKHLVEELREELGPNPFEISAHTMTNGVMAEIPKDLDFGHPKFEEARKCILSHFEQNANSRAIVFCEYRESVMLIYRLLLQHMPVLKPRCFVGQNSKSGCFRALSQKQQMQIMQDFRTGNSNILIATSIAEEGIDVGEVDLILCFDINTANPIRFIQRIGRTARQKHGQVIMLVTEGKEQKLLQDVLANKDQVNKKLLSSKVLKEILYKNSPRMVPTEFQPECLKIHVKPASPEKEKLEKPKMSKIKNKASKLTKKNLNSTPSSQDLRKFFQKMDSKAVVGAKNEGELESENDEDFEPSSPEEQTLPLEITQNSKARIERLFGQIQPCSSSNTQLLANETTQSSGCDTKTKQKQKLDAKYLKKLNKFMKSTVASSGMPKLEDSFLSYLKSENCSNAAKLFMLRKGFKKVKEICEQFDILQALQDAEAAEMSTHELEIRETYEFMLKLFDNRREALSRFLEDAELDDIAAAKRKIESQAQTEWYSLSMERYKSKIKPLIFKGLDLKGPSWNDFDGRLEMLKQTASYQEFLAKQKEAENTANNLAPNSMVFAAMPLDKSSVADDVDDNDDDDDYYQEDMTLQNQWENDFEPSCVPTKSTPLHCQKQSQLADKKLLESITEITATKTPLSIEASFRQRQQSTPIQPKQKETSSKKTFLADVLDLDFESVFAEPFPEEIELQAKSSTGKSLKKNAKPQAPARKSLFDLLEKQPVNSLLTPKRSFQGKSLTTPTTSKTCTITKASMTPTNVDKASTANASPKTQPNTPEIIAKSPQARQSTLQSKNAYEKSPSIFEKYARGLQRLESRRKMEANVENKQAQQPCKDLDSPLVRKRKRGNVELGKINIIESDSDDNVVVTPKTKQTNEESNSDDDFEAVNATPQLKRRRLPKTNKRARLCSFFDDEAQKSGGSGHSDDDDDEDETLGDFVCDNTIVEVADNEYGEAEVVGPTQMQAVYLQSVKSPNQRKPGGFKIPPPKHFNIEDIYSQAVPLEPTQYAIDSFVVHDDEAVEDQSLCPLERAERILKERRREAKRRRNDENEIELQKRKRKCFQLNDSDSSGGEQ